jgi:hypothetical protein
LSFDAQTKHNRLIKSGIDEYIGTNISQLETLPTTIKEHMMSCGIVIGDDELRNIVMEVRNELVKSKMNYQHQVQDAMDVDVRNI